MSKWVVYWPFSKKIPFFMKKSLTSLFFGRFWPICLFLLETCFCGLSFYEVTRLFWKNVKMGSETCFFFKKIPVFHVFLPFFCLLHSRLFFFGQYWPIFFIPSGSIFFCTVSLWINSIFGKNCKSELKNSFF